MADSGEYIIEKQGDSSKQLDLNQGAPSEFISGGTSVVFIPEPAGVALSGLTSANVSPLTTKATSLYIALETDEPDGTDCLKKDGMYNRGSDVNLCTGHLWYFILCKF